MKKKVAIVGSGNVAESLALAVKSSRNYRTVQLFARNRERGRELAAMAGIPFCDDPAHLIRADIYLVAVSDGAIREVTDRLDFGDAVMAHTSGSCGLGALSDKIRFKGVFYPLQTFTASIRQDFRKVPLFVEGGDERSETALLDLARDLSDSVTLADADTRRWLHVAAVFACNFVNRMYVVGERILARQGLDFSLVKPLIAETARKALENPSPSPLQTGPAVRRDLSIVEKHLALLADMPSVRYLYELITKDIIKDSE